MIYIICTACAIFSIILFLSISAGFKEKVPLIILLIIIFAYIFFLSDTTSKFIMIILTVLVYIIYTYNHFVSLHKKIEHSKANIDIYLTQRFDLIPNLVECVRQYSDHEEDIFTTIAENRSKYLETRNIKDGEIVNNQFNTILLQSEAYPDLEADEQFLYLQKSLAQIENELQDARRIYNIYVTNYNTAINTFPSALLASFFHFKDEPLFEAEATANANLNIKF